MVDERTIKAGDTSNTCFKVLNQCAARYFGKVNNNELGDDAQL